MGQGFKCVRHEATFSERARYDMQPDVDGGQIVFRDRAYWSVSSCRARPDPLGRKGRKVAKFPCNRAGSGLFIEVFLNNL
jgi:hypothetical protein